MCIGLEYSHSHSNTGAKTYHSRSCRKQTHSRGRRTPSLSQRSTAFSCSPSLFLGWQCSHRSASSSSSYSHPDGGLSGKTEKSQGLPRSHTGSQTPGQEGMRLVLPLSNERGTLLAQACGNLLQNGQILLMEVISFTKRLCT